MGSSDFLFVCLFKNYFSPARASVEDYKLYVLAGYLRIMWVFSKQECPCPTDG